jgi:hypothetical protein
MRGLLAVACTEFSHRASLVTRSVNEGATVHALSFISNRPSLRCFLADASGYHYFLADASGYYCFLADASGYHYCLADASGYHCVATRHCACSGDLHREGGSISPGLDYSLS